MSTPTTPRGGRVEDFTRAIEYPWRVRVRPRARERAPAIALTVVFVVVRVYAHTRGVRFDASQWERYWHFVDPVLLRERLWESLWYLHSQPPLTNLALGVSLRLFGAALPLAWQLAFVGAGAVFALCTYALARRLGVDAWPAALGAALLCARPSQILYENFLFYTCPLAALLVFIALGLHRAIDSGRARDFVWVAGGAALAVWTWSLFHPAWFLCVLAYIGFWLRGRPDAMRRFLQAATLPCVLVLALPLKNLVVFDAFATSSWRGMSLARVTLDRMPDALREDWVERGILSPAARVGPFKPLAHYAGAIRNAPPTGVALLDMPDKSNGAANLHHLAYLDVARTLERDAWTLIARRPDVYLRSVQANLWRATAPASRFRPLAPNRKHLRGLERAYAVPLLRSPRAEGTGLLAVVLPALVACSIAWAVRARDRSPAWRATLLYLALTWIFVVGGSALLERTENERFRFLVDAHVFVLALVAMQGLVSHARGPARRPSRT